MNKEKITVTVNGKRYEKEVEPRRLLSDFIRDDLRLTGTHVGCEHGVCGTCTVLMNGKSTRACLTFAVMADGADIMTIEGLGTAEKMHPLQQGFWEKHGLQCGFCTPGMVMTAVDLVQNHPNPTEQQIREGLEGNICRCTGYHNIVKAVSAGAKAMGR
jgi:carbon-monoxide dehydrogenase small subunit